LVGHRDFGRSRRREPPLRRSLVDAASRLAGKSAVDFVCDLLVAEELGVSALLHIGIEENVRTMLSHPAQMGGSDGILVGDRPHPRGWGAFARYFAVYVRELGLVGWEEM